MNRDKWVNTFQIDTQDGGKSEKGRKATETLLSVLPADIDFEGSEGRELLSCARTCLPALGQHRAESSVSVRFQQSWVLFGPSFLTILLEEAFAPPILSPSLCLIILKAISPSEMILSFYLFIYCPYFLF